METYIVQGLPQIQDTVELDLDFAGRTERLPQLSGAIVSKTSGTNLMGREFFSYPIRFDKLGQEAKAVTQQLL